MSKAIELAQWLEIGDWAKETNYKRDQLKKIADELRRLAAIEQEYKALQVNEINLNLELADLKAAMGEPVADLSISDDDFNLGLTDVYAMGTKRLENGSYNLYAKAKP